MVVEPNVHVDQIRTSPTVCWVQLFASEPRHDQGHNWGVGTCETVPMDGRAQTSATDSKGHLAAESYDDYPRVENVALAPSQGHERPRGAARHGREL